MIAGRFDVGPRNMSQLIEALRWVGAQYSADPLRSAAQTPS